MNMVLNTKKAVLFSSVEVKQFIENRTSIQAQMNKTSPSAVIENILLEKLLSKHPLVKQMIKAVYIANWKTEEVLEAVLSWNGEWINYESRYSNFLPLVEFVIGEQLYNNSFEIRNNERMYHFLDKVDSVAEKMHSLSLLAQDDMEKMYWEEEERYVRDLISQTSPKDTKLRPINFYKIFTKPKNWEIFKSKQLTYIVMVDLVILQKQWRNEPVVKEQVLTILESLSNEWNGEND